MKPVLRILALSAALGLPAGVPALAANAQFTDVSAAAGVNVTHSLFGNQFDHENYVAGGLVGDYDGDGWQDILIFSGAIGLKRDWLFMNNHDGTFTDRALQSGLTAIHFGKGGAVGDFNGDGSMDIFVTSAGTFGRSGPGHHKLYRNNGDGTFVDVAISAGLNFSTKSQQPEDGFGATFGDYDLDGDLDLFVAGFEDDNAGNRLFRNNGDETFTDVTDAMGLMNGLPDIRGFAPRFIDMNGDRYPELLLVGDFGTSHYFRNNAGTLVEHTAASGTGLDENGMGQTVGDFNGDGLFDWYVTSIHLQNHPSLTGNKLYLNTGNHTYTQNAAALGVHAGGYGWGALGVDFNHDRRLDIAETNGDANSSGSPFANIPSKLWIQNGTGAFNEVAAAAGMVHVGRGRGMANLDYDNDGDQDILIFSWNEQVRLFRNDVSGNDAHWIRIFLDTSGVTGLAPNGYGAKVSVTAGGQTQVRYLQTGDNFESHSEASAHFGLGTAQTVTTLRVDWPDGSVTTLSNVSADRTLTVAAGPREALCSDGNDNDNDGGIDCNDTDCCGQPGCSGGQGVCCQNNGQCNDGAFCNGVEQCIDNVCTARTGPGSDPCPGQACHEGVNSCVECLVDAECDDGLFCNGVEFCSGNLCVAGPSACPGQMCDEGFRRCGDCLTNSDCTDDGLFCNGNEFCADNRCVSDRANCAGRLCDEDLNSCTGSVPLQPRLGRPALDLTSLQLERFEVGRAAFESLVGEPAGLGPIYNAQRCSSCHSAGNGGAGSSAVTYFGQDDLQGGILPLPGGPLLQTQAISGSCAESLPPQADVVAARVGGAFAGSGLVEIIPEVFLHDGTTQPPAGVSGRSQIVPILEEPGEVSLGRLGWKSQAPTVRSMVAQELLGQLGVTSALLAAEHAPNDDDLLLAQCDTVSDPEDGQSIELLDRLTDYVRYLSPPPQTPSSGMSGATVFTNAGCAACHTPAQFAFGTLNIETWLTGGVILPYSDFLLHDMGVNGDPLSQDEGLPDEVRTTPLWGLRGRSALWHDGRFSGGSFESRVTAAIGAHGVAGSEGQAAAQAFQALSVNNRSALLAFLGSLGRAEFDHDGDNDVDGADFVQFNSCFTGPGSFYTPDHPCSVSDVDRDGDVDAADRTNFVVAADGPAGSVPDGAWVPGVPLTLAKLGGGMIELSWGASCSAGDVDYGIYEGALGGSFDSHGSIFCSTAGARVKALVPAAGSSYYLVVPTTGFREGSFGRDGSGAERGRGVSPCAVRGVGGCG